MHCVIKSLNSWVSISSEVSLSFLCLNSYFIQKHGKYACNFYGFQGSVINRSTWWEDWWGQRETAATHAQVEVTQWGQEEGQSSPLNMSHEHRLISLSSLLTFTLGHVSAPLPVGSAAPCLGSHDHVPVVTGVGDHGVVEKRAETCLAVRRIHRNLAFDGLVERREEWNSVVTVSEISNQLCSWKTWIIEALYMLSNNTHLNEIPIYVLHSSTITHLTTDKNELLPKQPHNHNSHILLNNKHNTYYNAFIIYYSLTNTLPETADFPLTPSVLGYIFATSFVCD